MDRKRALICSIILFVLGVGSLVPVILVPKTITPFTFLAPMFLISGIAMMIIGLLIGRKDKQRKEIVIDAKPNEEFDEEKFNEWLAKFEPLTKLGARFKEAEEETFTKFGGMPLVPKEFVWPTEFNWVVNGDEPIPFLLQIDFSEINGSNQLEDFPNEGLLYVFAEGENYDYKALFFDKTDDLITPSKPDALEIVYKQFHVTAEAVKTYPDVSDNKQAFDLYCDRPFGGADDGYDELQGENSDGFMLGGWASYVQEGGIIEKLNESDNGEWILLLQIGSADDDDNFTWGDAGTLYFFIKKSDLKSRDFSNVKLEMQCY